METHDDIESLLSVAVSKLSLWVDQTKSQFQSKDNDGRKKNKNPRNSFFGINFTFRVNLNLQHKCGLENYQSLQRDHVAYCPAACFWGVS